MPRTFYWAAWIVALCYIVCILFCAVAVVVIHPWIILGAGAIGGAGAIIHAYLWSWRRHEIHKDAWR